MAGIDAIMDFEFFPWGNAYWNGVTNPVNTSYYHCWVWGDVCGAAKHTGGPNPLYPNNLSPKCYPPNGGALINQHGPNEGKANLYEGCAKVLYPTNYWDFVVCYEAAGISRTDPASPTTLMQKCAGSVGMDANKIEACAANDKQATAINVANAKATNVRVSPLANHKNLRQPVPAALSVTLRRRSTQLTLALPGLPSTASLLM